MGVITANSIQLAYESFGNDEDPCVMLIRGLSSQLIYWPETLIDPIVAAGYRVLTFDNRDAGLSEKIKAPCDLDEVIADLIAGEKPDVPYTLHDMATDSAALLAALDIDQAHIMGISMGGRIAQLVAALFPHHVLTLSTVMSSTGNPALSRPAQHILDAVAGKSPTEKSKWVDKQIADEKLWEGSLYPHDEAHFRDVFSHAYDRCFTPDGTTRQLAAIYATGDQRDFCKEITAPTLVIHGNDDTLIPPDGGEDTAACISGAQLELIRGMGHDIPPQLGSKIAESMLHHFKRTDAP
ncbi:MAG: alpha/beta hydrolase [Pseudomonadota bacterium]|nr:alpha/beta hydrolase [Pseudomonadota bacterium]